MGGNAYYLFKFQLNTFLILLPKALSKPLIIPSDFPLNNLLNYYLKILIYFVRTHICMFIYIIYTHAYKHILLYYMYVYIYMYIYYMHQIY